MQVRKEQLCDSCLKIRPVMSDGSSDMSIEDWLECEGYKQPMGYAIINNHIIFYLEQNGGCSKCISLFG